MPWLGFDPGGRAGFGVALLDSRRKNPSVHTAVRSSAVEALEWAVDQMGEDRPAAAGIDSLMFWSGVNAGWRAADIWLRTCYGGAGKSVLAPNSLRGAMLIQGAVLAKLLRRRWQDLPITETHPKALYQALSGRSYGRKGVTRQMRSWLSENIGCDVNRRSEHEFDALLSAWAAREGSARRWPEDLRKKSGDDEVFDAVENPHYWWPSTRNGQ
jgi:hypothetical protein